MSSDWRSMTLRAAGVALIDCVHKTPAAIAEGYPYVTIPEMKNGRIDFEAARRISRSDFLEWTKKARPQTNDVILSRRTNPGVIAVDDSGAEFALGQNLVLLRADGRHVFPPFLRWLAQGPEWWEQINKFINVGAVFSSLRCGDVPHFELTIPPLPEQQAIAAVLGALDDKIELNRRMNRTLEAMARALFRSWFVDFDPVRAKAEGRAPAHMDPATAALFPARFGENGLPEGWKLGPASTLVEFNPRERLGKGEAAPYFDMKTLPTAGPRADAPIMRAFTSGTKFRNGDVLLARITPCLENGKTALVDAMPPGAVGWGSTEFIVMRGRGEVSPGFVYCLARDEGFRECAIQSMVGSSGRQRVQNERVETYKVAIPGAPILPVFAEATRSDFALISANGTQIDTLAALRDALLPKLMSGELRVRDAERVLAEAV